MPRGGRTGSVPTHMWTEQEERVLIDVLEELCVKGFRPDGQLKWKSGMYRVIEREFKKIMPDSEIVAYPHVESKMKVFKRNFMLIYNMIRTSGFGWDDDRQRVTVESDEVWNAYVKLHPKAAKWRNTSFPLYKRLATLYGKDRDDDGSNTRTPASGGAEVKEGPSPPHAGEEGASNNPKSKEDVDVAYPLSIYHAGSASRESSENEERTTSRRRSRFDMEADDQFNVIHSEIREWMDYMKERDRALHQGGTLDHDRENKVIDEISTFDCYSWREQNVAMEEILKSKQKMMMFLRFDKKRKIDYVKELLTSIGFYR